MRALFTGIVMVIIALVAIPFLAGFILNVASFGYFLSMISAILLIVGIILLFRGRISTGLTILILSALALLYSKGMIFNEFAWYYLFSETFYFAGIFVPVWLVVLLAIVIFISMVRKNSYRRN